MARFFINYPELTNKYLAGAEIRRMPQDIGDCEEHGDDQN